MPNPLTTAIQGKMNPGTPLPPPKTPAGGPGTPGFVATPISTSSLGQGVSGKAGFRGLNAPSLPGAVANANTSGINQVSTSKFSPGIPTGARPAPISGGNDNTNLQPQKPTVAGGTGTNAGGTGGSTTLSSTGGLPLTTPQTTSGGSTGGVTQGNGIIPNTTPGTPGAYANELQANYNKFNPLVTAPFQGSGTIGAESAMSQGAQAAEQNAASQITPLLAASQPQAFGYQSNVINPLTGAQEGNAAQGQGATAAAGGIAQSQLQAGQNVGTAAQAVGKAQVTAQNLDNLIQTSGLNGSDITYLNGAINFAKSNFGTPAQQAAVTELNGQITDIASSMAQVLGIPGGATTNFKTELGQSIVNGLQNGQSIQQSLDYFIQQAKQGSLGAFNASGNPIQSLNSTPQGGTPF